MQKYFFYSTGYVALAAAIGATAQTTLQITNDADFYIKWITAQVEVGGVIVANFSGTVQIEDTGISQNFFNVPIAVEAIRGNGQNPYPVAPPRKINANTSLIFYFTNRAATATNVQITLHGYKQW